MTKAIAALKARNDSQMKSVVKHYEELLEKQKGAWADAAGEAKKK